MRYNYCFRKIRKLREEDFIGFISKNKMDFIVFVMAFRCLFGITLWTHNEYHDHRFVLLPISIKISINTVDELSSLIYSDAICVTMTFILLIKLNFITRPKHNITHFIATYRQTANVTVNEIDIVCRICVKFI